MTQFNKCVMSQKSAKQKTAGCDHFNNMAYEMYPC